MRTNTFRKDDFYGPTLQMVRQLGGSGSIDEINDALIQRFGFTTEELEPAYEISGETILTHKMAWARTYLKFGDLLSNETRGVWVLTEAGRAAADLSEAELRRMIRAGKKQKKQARLGAAPDTRLGLEDVEELVDSEEPALDWSDHLLARLQSIEPAAFERLCQRLLREHGFTRVEVTGKSGDGGIDGQGVLRVNLVSFHVLFQCKRYKGSVGASTIRDFRGAMQGRADKGLVITTGTFTPDARREATRDGAPAIDLIDGEALCGLLRDVGLGVTVRQVITHEIAVDDTFFAEV